MDRLQMPAATPAEIAERLSDARVPEITTEVQEQARQELIDRLMAGRQVGWFRFEDILDCEIDANIRSTVQTVAGLLLDIIQYGTDPIHGERRAKVEQFIRTLVERHVDSKPELIEERALEIMHDEPEYEPECE